MADSSQTLAERLRDKGFTPGRRDAPALLRMVADADTHQRRELGKRVVAALGRADRPVADWLLRDLFEVGAAERALRVRAVARIAARVEIDGLAPALTRALEDADPRVVRAALRALGKVDDPTGFEAAVLRHLRDGALPERRAAADTLGKVGGPAAATALRAVETDDAELARRCGEAIALIERRRRRGDESAILTSVPLAAPARVLLRCRAGMARFAAQQARAFLDAADVAVDPGGVALPFAGSLEALRRVRIAADAALSVEMPSGGDLAERVVAGLSRAQTLRAMRAWTDGPLRFRLSLPDGASRRATMRAVAAALESAGSPLHNDSRAAPWSVEVDLDEGRLLCVPRSPASTRAQVAAASHRTLAALMAWVAAPRANEVVWDPFCGSGTELEECARLEPTVRLHGTDHSADALAAAERNLAAAGLDAALARGDSLEAEPPAETSLFITNPPMGRRASADVGVHELLRRVVDMAARTLPAGGRLVWVTPAAPISADAGRAAGFDVTDHGAIDLSGLRVHLQVMTR